MQPASPTDLHSVLYPNNLAAGFHWPNAYRKRQRSPCELRMDVPLSDPDIDCERGHSQKRYLSEIMATGLSLQMCLADADMDKGPEEPSDTEAAAARAPGCFSPLGATPHAHTFLDGNSPVMGLTRLSTLDTSASGVPSWPMQQHPRALSPPPRGAQGPSLNVPILNIPSRTGRADGRPNPMTSPRSPSAMRSPEPSPASPTDGRFPLDLRKTALLRSLLIRTDESSGAAASPEPDPSCMVAVVVPGEGDVPWELALPTPQELFMANAPEPAAAAPPPPAPVPAPPPVTRGGAGGRQAAPPVQIRPIPMTAPVHFTPSCHFDHSAPSAAVLSAPRGLSPYFSLNRLGSIALPNPCSEPPARPASSMTLSRSESCMDDTANSMDTSSTSSSAMQEEQSRRMSMQGVNSVSVPGMFMGGDGASSGLPPRYRGAVALNMAAAQSRVRMLAADAQALPEAPRARAGFRSNLAVVVPDTSCHGSQAAISELQAAGSTLLFTPPPAVDIHPIPGAPPCNLALPPFPGFAAGAAATAPTATSPSAHLPAATALPPAPTFEEARLLQLRTRALAESAKLVGDLEDLGQYRSFAPKLVTAPRHGAGAGAPGAGSLTQAAQRPGFGGSGLGSAGHSGAQPKLPGRRYFSDEGGADRDEGGTTGQEPHLRNWGRDT